MNRPRRLNFFIPGGKSLDAALKRATHLGVGAHPDDLEIMAFHGILAGIQNRKNKFFGIIVTDGAGSLREDPHKKMSETRFAEIRRHEQVRAARIGKYGGILFLNHSSGEAKNPKDDSIVSELKELILTSRPRWIYTHNPADKHDTHVAVALKTIRALRELPSRYHPKGFYGCEVWRDLDWMNDADKSVLDVSGQDSLGLKLIAAHRSQAGGGKRYDLAAIGRRRAQAVFSEARKQGKEAVILAMDLLPLLKNSKLSVQDFVAGHIERFKMETLSRVRALQK